MTGKEYCEGDRAIMTHTGISRIVCHLFQAILESALGKYYSNSNNLSIMFTDGK